MLAVDFQFHQGNLQDFHDCRRRFYYRWIEHLAWPSVEAEPVHENEAKMLRGSRFHRLIHQYYLGIPAETLARTIGSDEDLLGWWEDFMRWQRNSVASPAARSQASFYPEVNLHAGIDDHRLTAKLDLLVLTEDGKAHIFDWKTGGRSDRGQTDRTKRRKWLAGRMQTRVYAWIVSRAAASLAGGREVQPENIRMTYWFAGSPQPEEVFLYSARQQAEDKAELRREMALAVRLSGVDDFPLTPRKGNCRFCVYRSLCERGVSAAHISAEDDDEANEFASLEFDFDSVQEISIEE